MTDREMLMIAYGALKALNRSDLNLVVGLIEKHFEPKDEPQPPEQK